MNEIEFLQSMDDWALYQKVQRDELRHKELIREAIKNNLLELISKESVVLSRDNKNTRVVLELFKRYRIMFNSDKQKFLGLGDGNSLVGDTIDEDELTGQPANKYILAGDKRGEEIYEIEISIEEIEDIFFSEFELPNLIEKNNINNLKKYEDFNGIKKNGLIRNIDKKRTILESLKRYSRYNENRDWKIVKDDLRFLNFEDDRNAVKNTVVIAIIDASGSMGIFEKYIARTFYFWMIRFIRSKYESVEVVFITHNTVASEVTESEFFSTAESGGTVCSTAYKKALEIIMNRYPKDKNNIYLFHFSDGDNLIIDNETCIDYVKKLLTYSNMFFYGEINNYNRKSTLMSLYKRINDKNFKSVSIKQKSEIYNALSTFFSNN